MAVFELGQGDNDREQESSHPADRIVTVSDAKPDADRCYARVGIPKAVMAEIEVSAGDKVAWEVTDDGRLTVEVI